MQLPIPHVDSLASPSVCTKLSHFLFCAWSKCNNITALAHLNVLPISVGTIFHIFGFKVEREIFKRIPENRQTHRERDMFAVRDSSVCASVSRKLRGSVCRAIICARASCNKNVDQFQRQNYFSFSINAQHLQHWLSFSFIRKFCTPIFGLCLLRFEQRQLDESRTSGLRDENVVWSNYCFGFGGRLCVCDRDFGEWLRFRSMGAGQ